MATTTQITTGRVRFSYVNAFTPRAAQEGAQPKYSVTLLIPKTDKNTIAKIKAAIEARLPAEALWQEVALRSENHYARRRRRTSKRRRVRS